MNNLKQYKAIKKRTKKINRIKYGHSWQNTLLTWGMTSVDFVQLALNFSQGVGFNIYASILLAVPLAVAIDMILSVAADQVSAGKEKNEDRKKEIMVCWLIFSIGIGICFALFFTSQRDFYSALVYVPEGEEFQLKPLHWAVTVARCGALVLTSLVVYMFTLRDNEQRDERLARKKSVLDIERQYQLNELQLQLEEAMYYQSYDRNQDVQDMIANYQSEIDELNRLLNREYREKLAAEIHTPDATAVMEEQKQISIPAAAEEKDKKEEDEDTNEQDKTETENDHV